MASSINLRSAQWAILCAWLVCVLSTRLPAQSTNESRPHAPPGSSKPAPGKLPGKGLRQHDFLYCGEWDTRKTNQTMFLIKSGKVVWTYQIPIKDANGNLSEFSDMHRLSNGDIVFAYKTGWRKINAAGDTLYDYQCPVIATNADGKPVWAECHSAQPIGPDRVFFMQNGMPAKCFLFNLKTRQLEMQHEVKTKPPVDAKSIHGQFRNVRMTKAGTYLLAHMNLVARVGDRAFRNDKGAQTQAIAALECDGVG